MLSVTRFRKICDHNFIGDDEKQITKVMASVGGPPLRDPSAVLNALACLDISLPFGLDGLPLLCVSAGLQWKKTLFPMSGGDFRKIVAAVFLGPVETSNIDPEVLAHTEHAVAKFPATTGNQSKALNFLQAQVQGKLSQQQQENHQKSFSAKSKSKENEK